MAAGLEFTMAALNDIHKPATVFAHGCKVIILLAAYSFIGIFQP